MNRAPSLWASSWIALAGVLVGGAAWLLHHQRTEAVAAWQAEQNGSAPPAAVDDDPRRDWFRRSVLGAAGTPGDPGGIETRGFPGVSLEGADALDAEDARSVAVRAELGRWSAGGELPMEATRLAVEQADARAWSTLIVEAQGSEAEALASLQHLLAAPGLDGGYLTDPGRVVIESAGPGKLRFELRLRVWPIEAFVGSTEAGS
ncbi:MAG: hypothetical protein CMJ94_09695 [Planctomycetes bacterium]|nr:hypothetical protein [Planctomycetota bacterium]